MSVVKVTLSPDILESANALHFQKQIQRIIENGAKIIMLDLKNITFLTNSGLMTLVSIMKLVKASNCILLISSISEQVRMLFELTGLEQMFNCFPNGEELSVSSEVTELGSFKSVAL
ncbi:MAG TPA: STAS domain-containing protein [Kamptonema sp.]|nr:STAS domain-containing protein [Kamptonema sp.]